MAGEGELSVTAARVQIQQKSTGIAEAYKTPKTKGKRELLELPVAICISLTRDKVWGRKTSPKKTQKTLFNFSSQMIEHQVETGRRIIGMKPFRLMLDVGTPSVWGTISAIASERDGRDAIFPLGQPV